MSKHGDTILPVTIGTDKGDWAPPRPVVFKLTPDLNIVNAETIRWQISGKARLCYGAVYLRGAWRVIWPIDVLVRSGEEATIKAGELSIDVELPYEHEPHSELPSAQHAELIA